MRSRSIALVAVLAIAITSCAATSNEAAGPSEGIAVHGEWTIEVRDPDGSLAGRLEFSNALVDFGRQHLVALLAGTGSAGSWNFEIGESATGGSVCPSSSAAQGRCIVGAETVDQLDTDGNGLPDTLLLAGSRDVEADGTIAFVRTVLRRCDSNIAPDGCVGIGTFRTFTEKTLDASQTAPVKAGQSVVVSVEISFTSG